MARYYDADAVVSKLDNLVEEYVKHDCIQSSLAAGVLADFRDTELNEIPFADVVEVVRCKDCINVTEQTNEAVIRCRLSGRNYPNNHFCSYGERKEDEGK